jgi:hypothetical protein
MNSVLRMPTTPTRSKGLLELVFEQQLNKKKKKHEKIACGVAGGRREDAGAAGTPNLQGRSEVQGRGRES